MHASSFAKDSSLSQSADIGSVDERLLRPHGLKGVYYHPVTQLIMLSFVCFLCPGMFNALTGLGGGGQLTATTSANATCAVYATYAFVAFFAGAVNNKIGPKWTLFLGTFGYALYMGSYLAINIHPNAGNFVVSSGAILGATAALLWTAQGSLMLSYPTEAQKGIFISIFWAILSLGAVVGSCVSFGQNIHSTKNSVGNGTYIGILILSLIGIIIPLLMADPNKMMRTDGTKVVTPRSTSWNSEFRNLWVVVKSDPAILLLFPMFFASNYFFTWQFNDYNSALFNIRARSLNNLVYWVSQIIGCFIIGLLLDSPRFQRRTRAFAGWTILFVMTFIVHVWAYEYQKFYTRQSIPFNAQKMDIYDSAFPAHIWLMIFYGLLDSMWQTMAFWLIGAMSNDPNKLAIYSGYYHSIQSAGAAGAWRMDAVGLPYMNIFLSTWCLVVAGLLFSFPMIYMRIRETTVLDDEFILKKALEDARKNEDIMMSAEKVKGHSARKCQSSVP